MNILLRIFLLLLALLPAAGFAHKGSDSYLTLDLAPDGRLTGRWDLALRDLDLLLPLDADQDRRLTWGEVRRGSDAIRALAAASLSLGNGGKACTLDLATAALAIDEHVDGRYVVLPLDGRCARGDRLAIGYHLLHGIDAGHRGLVTVRVQGQAHTLVMAPSAPAQMQETTTTSAWQQVREGIHHIATGYDHLLFLLSLLLPVALLAPRDGRNSGALRNTLALVTAFTLAHSLTLALATFDIIRLPSRWVEATIAASVLVTSLHNLRRGAPRTRARMAFGFGLIHGLGFASMLGELPVATGPRLLALLAFNAGVEIGQLLAVALFLPVALLLASRHPEPYRRWGLQAGSLAIGTVALAWLCQRVFGLQLIPG